MWWVSLWEALIVVSQKWSFPTALVRSLSKISVAKDNTADCGLRRCLHRSAGRRPESQASGALGNRRTPSTKRTSGNQKISSIRPLEQG